MKKEHGTERSAFCFRCQEVGSLLVWNICPQVQRVKTWMEAQTSALETYWAEAIDKSVLETSGRVSNCIPTACLHWALLLASLNDFDFEGLLGFFVVFLISYVLQFILYHRNQRNISERQLMQRMTQTYIHPAEKNNAHASAAETIKSVTRKLENKKVGQVIETKANPLIKYSN